MARSACISHRACLNQVFARPQYRALHYTQKQNEAVASTAPVQHLVTTPLLPPQRPNKPPLSLLPFTTLFRSYLINSLSSTPVLLNPSLRIMTLLAHSESSFFNPDRNPVLHYLLKKTFYVNFCAGETRSEIQKTVTDLKNIGYTGVMLAYAREIVLPKGHNPSTGNGVSQVEAESEVGTWMDGNLSTVRLTEGGEFVGLKFTGAGRHAVDLLARAKAPSDIIEKATIEVCDLAKARDVRLLFDAEQRAIQPGIDAWTLRYQKLYNKGLPGKAIVYGTYQAYLRSTPAILAEHLAIARKEGFTLGVKLVRGAYMNSDPRELFWATKEETDMAYDGIAEALLKTKYNQVLRPSEHSGEELPAVSLVLASHNHLSVKKAMSIQKAQADKGEKRIDMAYGQLMGMADEVSCELALAGKRQEQLGQGIGSEGKGPKIFKYLVWGSVGECMKYLLRRAEENRDAILRARESRTALKDELRRRILKVFT